MRPGRRRATGNLPRGRRNPDRSSEKFAYSIAEVTDPLALKVPSGADPAKHKSAIPSLSCDASPSAASLQTSFQKLTIIRVVGVSSAA
jgi:hypothetical protein